MSFVYQADTRYVGQSYELTIALPDSYLKSNRIEETLNLFHSEHERSYGFKAENEPVEFVALRLSAIGEISKPQVRVLSMGSRDASNALKVTRPVYFAETGRAGRLSDLRSVRAAIWQ